MNASSPSRNWNRRAHLLQYALESAPGRSAAHHRTHRRCSVRAADMAEKSEKQLVVGILAHVDSGKTTLSEAMLYRAGSIRKLGRVDNKDAFLDTDTLEKARGITIFPSRPC